MAVKVLVIEAQWKIVSASTARWVSKSAMPWTAANVDSPRTTTSLLPTMPSSAEAVVKKV